jgi:hypothetical protein
LVYLLLFFQEYDTIIKGPTQGAEKRSEEVEMHGANERKGEA